LPNCAWLLVAFGTVGQAAAGSMPAKESGLPAITYPTLPASGAQLSSFTPAGWRIETSARGDLNGDGRPDLAFTLRTSRPVFAVTRIGMGAGRKFDSTPRILAVIFASSEGLGYRLALQNRTLIPRPADPTQAEWMFEAGSLAIERGALKVMLAHLGSSAGGTSFTFRWREGAFRLIGYDFSDVHRYTHCTNTVSINYLTRRMKISRMLDDDAPERTQWRRISPRALTTIDEIGDGLAFDPENASESISC
jgi:hypothetical protein